MRFLKSLSPCLFLAVATAISAPASAQDPNAYPVTNVNLRAGPGTEYPVILTVPADAPITILGCLPDYSWCDSVFRNYRGWMSAVYLSGYYEGDYYLLRDYAPDLGYQQVTFNINAYWDDYYRDEPFYRERDRWARPYGEGYVNEAVFYDRLAPHGSWTYIQGRYVFVPSGVDRGWRPYTNGRWVYTNRGWTWVSNEPYGWATYHYGRWGYSNRVGWFWVPGNQWAPAWVSWRQSDDYLAWAPLPPAYDDGYGYDRGSGININISFGNVPDYYWSVVPSRDFLSDDLPRYYVRDRDRRRPFLERSRPIGHTKIVNKTVVNNVVNVNYVEQKTETKIVERQIAPTASVEQAGTVEGDTLEVYEPKADETPEAVAPPETKTVEEVAAVSETKGQAEGEATTEEQLAPEAVQEAIKERKGGKGRKRAKADAESAETLPEGDIADAPPPDGAKNAKKKKEPVPAHELAAPEADQPASEAKDAPEPDEKTGPAPKSADEETAPQAREPESADDTPQETKPAPDGDGTPEAPAAKSEETPKPDAKPEAKPKATDKKPSEKKAGPAEKAPKPQGKEKPGPKAKSEPAPPKPESEGPPVIDDAPPPEPKAAPEPEPKEPEVKKPEPKAPEPEPMMGKPEPPAPKADAPALDEAAPPPPAQAKQPESKPDAPKPEPKKPEAPKPEPKKPEPKKPEAKKPEPKKPEAKKPAPPKKPEARKSEPKKAEPKKSESKRPAPNKQDAKPQAKRPEPNKPSPQKREAKQPAPQKQEVKRPAPPKREARTPAPPKREARKPAPPKREAKGGGGGPQSKAASRPAGAGPASKARTAQADEDEKKRRKQNR